MAIPIEMPKLSDTMTEGTLVAWHKKVGDEVEVGDILAEIETDKATMEMEAFDDGILSEIFIQEGEKAEIGAKLAMLSEDGEGAAAPAPEKTEDTPVVTEGMAGEPSQEPQQSAAPALSATPSEAPSAGDGSRVKASPLARKIAAADGIDLSSVSGSGPNGRIVKKDLEGASAQGQQATSAPAPSKESEAAAALAASAKQKATATPAPEPKAAPAPAAPKPVPSPAATGEDKEIPLTGMRRIIADRLLQSKQTIPHFYLHVEADVAPMMSLRKQVNAQAETTHGNKYTVNDFILKAVINASVAVPEVNATYTGESIIQFAHVGVSVVIAVEDGLVTPVVKNAETKSLLQISREVKDMAVRARDKKLKPNEFDGGTITVSNLGSYGIDSFDAIVNPPQAAILSVGGIVEKPVVKDGAIVPGLRMNLGLSCDHRVVDGAVGAKFLGEIKKLIENPALMLI